MDIIETKGGQDGVDHFAEDRGAPLAFLPLDPDAQDFRDLPHVEPPVQRFPKNRNAVADRASRIDQLIRLVPHAAAVALVAICVLVVALGIRTLPSDKSILEKTIQLGIEPLKAGTLLQHAVLV